MFSDWITTDLWGFWTGGAGTGPTYGTTLILTDRTATGDGVTLSADRDVSYSFDAGDTTGGGIA